MILEAAQKQNKKAEAAVWCALYAFDGVRAGEAFLPSKDELVEIFKNLSAIQKALEKISSCLLKEDYWYWSSSEYSYYNAWGVRPSDGYNAWGVRPSDGSMTNFTNKDGNYRVRCVLAF